MSKEESASEYRVNPSLRNGLLVAILYVVYFSIALKVSGVGYENITDSPNNVLKAVVIPMIGGAILLTAIAKWSGWWKDLWHDKYKIKGHSWMYLFPIIMAVGIISTLASAKFGNTTGQMIGYIFIGTALVGYNEELLFRGMVLRGARGSGLTELKVMLVVALSFGIFHGANFFLGQDLPATMQQVAFATIEGAVFYMIFRKTGLLIVAMILHGLWDFSVFTREATLGSNPELAPVFTFIGVIGLYLPIILLLFSLKNVNVKNDKKSEVSA
jgi:membrane protease YdiL (CAAX protease family)